MTPDEEHDDRRARSIAHLQFAVKALREAHEHLLLVDPDIADEDLTHEARTLTAYLASDLAKNAEAMTP